MKEQIKNRIRISINTKELILKDDDLLNLIERLSKDCLDALYNGGKIIFAGNGGSFGDAQHLSAEFTSRFLFDRGPYHSLVLGTNNSALSAIGNDYGFEQVFARELRGIAQPQRCFHWNLYEWQQSEYHCCISS